MSNDQLERISQASTIAAHTEIASIRKVLEIQQQENYRFRDHVKMLDGEIDALKALCESKQDEIIKAHNTIRSRDTKIDELNVFIKENIINKDEVKKYSAQNSILEATFKEHQLTIDELSREIKFLKRENERINEILNIKNETSIDMDAKYQAIYNNT